MFTNSTIFQHINMSQHTPDSEVPTHDMIRLHEQHTMLNNQKAFQKLNRHFLLPNLLLSQDVKYLLQIFTNSNRFVIIFTNSNRLLITFTNSSRLLIIFTNSGRLLIILTNSNRLLKLNINATKISNSITQIIYC